MSRKSYICTACDYYSYSRYNYNKHTATQKHITNIQVEKMIETGTNVSNNSEPINDIVQIEINQMKCEYCNKIILKTNKARHYKICKYKQVNEIIDKNTYQTENDKLKAENVRIKADNDRLKNGAGLNAWM